MIESLPSRAETEAICRRTTNASQCVEWLKTIGAHVLGVSVDRGGAVVKVASAPFLWRVFGGDCAWQERRQEGAVTVFVWFAVRFGALIEWEERQCRG